VLTFTPAASSPFARGPLLVLMSLGIVAGQKTYPCTLAALDERWRTGRPDCWGPARFGLAEAGDAVTAEESLGRLPADEEDSSLT